ncbi:hypothetical protein O0L34_g703 [Tuta absoluta]|nr:hypothetical protein O0L34_g703 [Tuta absoluta]
MPKLDHKDHKDHKGQDHKDHQLAPQLLLQDHKDQLLLLNKALDRPLPLQLLPMREELVPHHMLHMDGQELRRRVFFLADNSLSRSALVVVLAAPAELVY